jgi:ParB-like chromosome segregation protein Spo0J
MKLDELILREPANVDWDRVYKESPGLFALAMDIKNNGVQQPIILDEEGKIEDGIHRIFACWLLSWDGDIPTEEKKCLKPQ